MVKFILFIKQLIVEQLMGDNSYWETLSNSNVKNVFLISFSLTGQFGKQTKQKTNEQNSYKLSYKRHSVAIKIAIPLDLVNVLNSKLY